MSESASWFAGCGFDFGFPHYFGPVDNRLDTNHVAVNQQKKEGRLKKMRVCKDFELGYLTGLEKYGGL